MKSLFTALIVLATACSSTPTSSGSGAVGGGVVDIGNVAFDAMDPDGSSGAGGGSGAGDGSGLSDGSGTGSSKDGSGGTAGFGEPCKANADCKSGYCIDGYAGQVCSQTCNGECPVGYACQKVFSNNKPVQLCVPQVSKLCRVCNDDLDCAGGSCVKSGDEQFCAPSCAAGAPPCPASHSCQQVKGPDGQPQPVCMPKSGSCQCKAASQGLIRACEQNAGPKTCYGISVCDGANWGSCQLPSEICDGTDNNCDGQIDEGFVDGQGNYTTLQACGGCGNNCSILKFDHAATQCLVTKCGFTCDAGWFDVNDNPKDGCECQKTSDTDLPDGPDQNCDGIDGEVGNGIFVALTGKAGNPGTLDQPVATIAEGIQQALAQKKRDVYVASGVYGESVTLVAGVHLYGGYSATFKYHDPKGYETVVMGTAPTADKPGAVNAIGLQGEATLDGFTVFGANVKTKGASTYAIYVRDCGPGLHVRGNKVFGGDAGSGVPGSAGGNGEAGVVGTAGVKAKDIGKASCAAADDSSGGKGGVKTCGGVDVSGGGGGKAICPDYDESGTQPKSSPYKQTQTADEQGTGGKGPSAGKGGVSGYDSLIWEGSNCNICSPPKLSDSDPFLPTVGTNGANGGKGAAGVAGNGCLEAVGGVVDGLWQPGSSSAGGAGGPGSGGGGGGAGGGVEVSNKCTAAALFKNPDLGGSGGGGGSGGCGGTGGTAGSSGGGSFALFVVFTAAPAGLPDIQNNVLVTGNGGDGGSGGLGGVGGQGGDGKFGGADDGGGLAWCASGGGRGGQGGDGGHGGGGGGGCGGVSFGIYLAGAGGLDPKALAAANSVQLVGVGGAGGDGGKSMGKGGGNGTPGAGGASNF
jgi:hypothetical protein